MNICRIPTSGAFCKTLPSPAQATKARCRSQRGGRQAQTAKAPRHKNGREKSRPRKALPPEPMPMHRQRRPHRAALRPVPVCRLRRRQGGDHQYIRQDTGPCRQNRIRRQDKRLCRIDRHVPAGRSFRRLHYRFGRRHHSPQDHVRHGRSGLPPFRQLPSRRKL